MKMKLFSSSLDLCTQNGYNRTQNGCKMKEDISSTLFGKTRRALLTLLLTRSGEEFYLRQMIVEARTGFGATQRELTTLVGSGIVERRQKGKKIFYQANNKSPVFKELRSLLTKTAGAGEAVKKALLSLKDRIEVAFLYGSAAEGAFRGAGSDIDLMVIGKASFSEISSVLRPAEELLGREINPTVYSTKEFKKKIFFKHHFVLNVLKRSKVYILGGERELAELGKK